MRSQKCDRKNVNTKMWSQLNMNQNVEIIKKENYTVKEEIKCENRKMRK